MTLLSAFVEHDEYAGLNRQTIHLRPMVYRRDGNLRRIADSFVDGDANLPHIVTDAPLQVAVTDEGMRRIYPTREADRYIEIGTPYVKVGGVWRKVGFTGATRAANSITWARTQADMRVSFGGHLCKLDIELKGGYVPEGNLIAFPVGISGLTRNGSSILREGSVVASLRRPFVYDAANPLTIARVIGTRFTTIGGLPYLVMTLPDLTGLTRPTIDPVVTLQPDSAGIDTDIYYKPDTNHGSDPTLDALCGSVDTDIRRAIIKFDLSSIPSDATLTSAVFAWTCRVDVAAAQVNIHYITRSWTESGATWVKYDGSNNWGTAGGDYNSTVQAYVNPASYVSGTVYEFTITSLVQSWLNGSITNNGMLGKVSTETTKAVGLGGHSSDATTASYRPQLTVTYTIPRRRTLLGVGK